ncbi:MULTISPECIES: hypothetical protein [Leptospira]|uniref:Uncharacterized protein n=3 Tax=Leptospira borgpetersenii TaxID=174 RepID=M3HUI0_LEPBO|nr:MULTISPECIES: hypothetical protein [Leptospira]EKP14312.1 hypothetical protein LEP1GSC128_2720 [Leptospira borgpetersenii str. 200801926]EMG01711.1 hypothetical protein LEP1GSC123_1604 [Leptospira borgpetersenii str. 200701203]EMK08372.1 hypothetical protein LEP1GSC066_1135 [Leptospira sp. serovar Kenya str. Sh9]ENO63678.1 hypothetical protein LEP1GSC191_1564 [Leptospira borgpetersenii serovar Mini str. 201000851]
MNRLQIRNFFNAIYISVIALLLTQCLGHHFTIPKEKVKSDIKKVLVLPVYISKDFVPNYFPKEPDFQPNAKESEEYRESVRETGNFLRRAIESILSKGSYEFQTVEYTDDFSKESANFEKIVKNTINEYPTVFPTDVYFPKKEYIQKMAKKYQADAIFYHTLYVEYRKSKYFRLEGRRYTYLPTFLVLYEPLMYSANGDLIYNSEEVNYILGALHSPKSISEDKVRSSKISVADLKSDLSKSNIHRILITGFNERRDSALASLCGNIATCNSIYLDVSEN